MKKLLLIIPLLSSAVYADLLDDTFRFYIYKEYKRTPIYKNLTKPSTKPDIIDEAIIYWKPLLRKTEQNYAKYKMYNPYRAVVIESLIETGAIAVTLVTLPQTGIIKMTLSLPKGIPSLASSPDILIATTKKSRLYITSEAYELYLLKSGRQVTFNNTRVVQRNIFPYNYKNRALMKNGNAPIGYDGRPVELHHLKQNNKGTLIEMLSKNEHQKHTKILHTSGQASTIERSKFNTFRAQYWKERAENI